MKKLLVVGGIAVGAVTIVWAVGQTSHQFLTAQSHAQSSCSHVGKAYQVQIHSNMTEPSSVQAHRCDTLTIVNHDETLRMIAFGPHDQQQADGSVSEHTLTHGQSFTITLEQTGTFTFHDHLHTQISASFTVSE